MWRNLLMMGLAVIGWLIAVMPAAAQTTMTVQVKTTQLRADPSYFGKIVAELSYREQVEVLEETSGWIRIRQAGTGQQGWVNRAALTTQRLEIKSGTATVGHSATGDEVALAGKALKETEQKFQQANPNLDYAWVDKMEKFVMPEAAMKKFLRDGGLNPEQGGQ